MSHIRDVNIHRLKHTIGILVTTTDCVDTANRVPADKRTLYRCSPNTLKASWLKESHAIAVLLCPGDDTGQLADFAARHHVHPDVVHFYAAPGVDILSALRAWREAGLYVHSITDVRNGGDVNHHFLDHWNRILHDAVCTRAECVMHVIQ